MATRKTKKKLLSSFENFYTEMTHRVKGHDEHIQKMLQYVDVYRANLNQYNRPAGVFLLLGPTGCGKTFTVEMMAKTLQSTPEHMITINCGEYSAEHEVAKLIGAPPGYLGHRETQPAITNTKMRAATFTNANPSIVLFDEIEKGSMSLLRLLLGILDKGTLTLGDSSVVSFSNTLIFLTSNLGAADISKMLSPDKNIGFTQTFSTDQKRINNVATSSAKKHFPPEFMNRVDETFTYMPLGENEINDITTNMLREFQGFVVQRAKVAVNFNDEVVKYLSVKGFSPEYGARELKRILFREVKSPVARIITDSNSNNVLKSISLSIEDDKIMVTPHFTKNKAVKNEKTAAGTEAVQVSRPTDTV
jgi:ATP-dependent Clp protease ATP-binding subunit ClpA